jgi:hypothetical protein
MAVMGITEVIQHLPRIYREYRARNSSISMAPYSSPLASPAEMKMVGSDIRAPRPALET